MNSPKLLPSSGGGSTALSRLRNSVAESADTSGSGVETGIEAPRRIGLLIAFVVFGVFGLWSVIAPLGSFAYAPGFVAVKSHKKPIQHFEGGIVKSVLVQDGDLVEKDQVLVELDSTQSFAQLEIFNGQMTALIALEARLLAERDNLDTIVWPEELPSEGLGENERRAQQQIFAARKASRAGEKEVLEQRVGQLESRLVGLTAMQESKAELAQSFSEELADIQKLLDEGFENKSRLRDLERNHAVAAGEAAEITSTIASTEIQIGETRLQIIQLQNEFQREVANELARTQNELQNARERVTALRDIVTRTEVRAPDAGTVNQLQVHSAGEVISPGRPFAEIVPLNEDLIIESTLQPTDIDRVAEGQEARVRLSAFNSKTVPQLYGTVMSISADAVSDQNTGARFYTARIQLNQESMEALEGMELVPGMPAEAFISTGSRTFLEYLMKPLSNSIARSFNED